MHIHQDKNAIGKLIYRNTLYRMQDHALHLHRTYELVYVLEGELTVTVEGRVETAGPGEGFVIFPYQLHSLTCAPDTLYLIILASGFYIGTFSHYVVGKVPVTARFRYSAEATSLLKSRIIGNHTHDREGELLLPMPPMVTLKSCLYLFCADFLDTVQLTDKKQHDDLVSQVLFYVEEHFTERLTLQQIADALSYDYHYISRMFNETLNINLKTLVNQYRYEMSRELLVNTDRSIADIAMTCGFQSIRSFNRVFLQFSGDTPTVLRRQQK